MKKLLYAILLFSFTSLMAQSITVTSPNGGERFQKGSNNTITWNSTGAALNVKIEITFDGGATYVPVVASTPAATRSFSYNFPTTSSLCKIKISDAANAADFDISDNNFTVGAVNLTSPDGAEHIQVGKVFNIGWTVNEVTNVKLEYTTDNGASWNPIASSVNGALLTYAWTVPNTSSNSCKVRISDVTTAAIQDFSSAVFTIASLVLTSPNGGENYLESSTKTITWTSSQIASVKLEYTIDGGANFLPIANPVVASLGSYNWTVPVGVSTNCFVKISDAAFASISDESNSAFTISNLSLTAPLANAIWRVGSTQNITWTSSNITNLKIEYSTNNGTSWLIILASKAAAGGTHSWTVPVTASTQCKIKLTDVSYPNNFVISNVFEIEPIPAIQVISPNGNENWQESSTHNITWNATYNIANVNIDYSLDNGATWVVIANNVAANLGTRSWTLPAATSAQGLVRVTNSADVNNNDVSNSPFTISSLNLTVPNGAEKWQVGKQYNITWNSSNISNVKLEYSVDNGTNWNIISASVPAINNLYSWTIPNSISAQAKVKISDASNSFIKDESAATFTIANVILTSPNGGETLLEGSNHLVTWTSQNIANVKLEYSANSGASWNVIVASTPAAANNYTWTVPANSASSYKFRISDAVDATINDLSDAEFTVSKLNLTSPVGTEDWKVGTPHNITWESSSTLTNVKLEYTTNNGSNWLLIASSVPAANFTYRWIVPNTTSVNCKVRISSVSSSNINSVSQAFFTISKSLIVNTPNGGENWEVGSLRNIKWTRDPAINFIRIEFTIDNGLNWASINNNVDASLGTYAWTIPNLLSANCLVRIADVNNITNIDSSNAKFSIVATSTITVTRPNGAEIFETGALENITWNSSFVNLVKLEYSTNNGSSWNLIKSGEASDGSYQWNVPNTSSSQCRIKITDESNPNVFDLSDNKFTINPRIVVTSPNGGESLYAANTFTVTWTSLNTANVKIEYSTDNGLAWSTAVASTPAAAGSYLWTVANVSSSACLIKVSDVVKPDVYDISDNNFSIVNKIKVVSPNGGESWQSNSIKEIKWTSIGVTNVAIAYSTNNGISWSTIVASTAASTGTYTWTLPSTTLNMYKVKISDAANSSINDISDNSFTVSLLDLTKPNGGESYPVGSTQTITWTSNYISKVKLEYSINGGIDWTAISDTGITSNGIFYWQVPNTPSNQCKVKIYDFNNLSTQDVSLNSFTILETPTVTVVYPNGRDTLRIGKTELIKWSSNSVNNVKIEYSVNGGTSWSTIISSTPSTGAYSWVVPNVSSSLCKIKISDASRVGVTDQSDNVFTIIDAPKITVLYPSDVNIKINIGAPTSIKWTSINVSKVKLEYSVNNGVDWELIENNFPSTGVYDWQVPNVPSTLCLIRISDSSDPLIFDVSDNKFEITAAPYITLTSPNAKEVWEIGKTQYITWKSNNVNDVKIEYSLNNGSNWSTIITTTKSTGSYSWAVPNTPSVQCKVKISDVTKAMVYDVSDSVFTIAFSPKLAITYPNGSESIKGGSKQNITWTSTSVDSIKLEYSINNGVSWSLIEKSFPSTGTYIWDVPQVSSYQCKIKISDTVNKDVLDISDNTFTISVLDLLKPMSGETVLAGAPYEIKWNSAGITNLKIELSTNDGGQWSVINASVSATSQRYTWNVPSSTIAQCKIRISDVSKSIINDVNDPSFSIRQIIVVSPNEYSRWPINTTQIIQWKSNNVVNIKMDYSADNGINWKPIAAAIPATVGMYYWIVPNSPSNICIVKIADAANQSSFATNKDNFAIEATTAVKEEQNVPSSYSLNQNYPNPFNPITTISYSLPKQCFVSLKVYDMLGNLVMVLANGERSAGTHQVTFDGKTIASGVYIYRLETNGFAESRKLILLK